MYRKELTLKESQQASLQVLIKFDELCTQQGFRYWLTYGTLLGAIRHNGFIPWDDDVDIMMPRQDYNKFVEYVRKNESGLYPFQFHNRENTQNYYYRVSRFSDMRYRYVTSNSWEKDFDIGAFIDLYVLDYAGNSYEEALNIISECKKINQRYEYYINPKSKMGLPRSLFRATLSKFIRTKEGRKYNSKIENEIINYINSHTSEDDCFLSTESCCFESVVYKKEEWDGFETQMHEFEGYSFRVQKNYHEFLKKTYGNYLILPPQSEQHPTHSYKIYRRYDE